MELRAKELRPKETRALRPGMELRLELRTGAR
jgi:hypothetical protein